MQFKNIKATKEQIIRLLGKIFSIIGGYLIASLAFQYNDFKIIIAALLLSAGALIFGADDE